MFQDPLSHQLFGYGYSTRRGIWTMDDGFTYPSAFGMPVLKFIDFIRGKRVLDSASGYAGLAKDIISHGLDVHISSLDPVYQANFFY